MLDDRRSFLRAAGVVAVGLLGGCTGSGGGGDTPSPTVTPTPTATASSTVSPTASPSPTPESAAAQERYPDYSWDRLDGVAPEPTNEIEMVGFDFHPLVAAVGPGTEVTVANAGGRTHTVTVPMLDIDRTLSGGSTTSFTVDLTGTFDYVCTFHPPDMLGRIVVTEDTPTPDGSVTSTPTPTEGGGLY